MISASNFAQKKKTIDPAAKLKDEATQDIQSKSDLYKKNAMEIWNYAEVGYKEVKSSALHQQTLKDNGFTVEAGIAGMPTAFVATYGSGSPVIAILAEYDALPGLSQDNSPTKTAVANKTSAHACGHHLFGTGSVAAGIAIKKLLEAGKIKGTIKVFGCPAEEGGSGKVYLVREGYFNGCRPEIANTLNSAGKSILSALFGIAFGDGTFTSLNTPISQLLPPEYYPNLFDPNRAVTLGNIMTMTSGLKATHDFTLTDWDNIVGKSDDWLKTTLSASPATAVGTYSYTSMNNEIGAHILTGKVGSLVCRTNASSRSYC